MIRLEVLPAGHGDALVVSYPAASGQTHRILVDGGPAHTYQAGLYAYLDALDANDRTFDVFVVTHVDADHIDGSLILLQDREQLGVQFADVWFNGWRQLGDATADDRGALQGEFLAELLDKEERWNATFGGAPVLRAVEQRVELAGGAGLTVLSPTVVQARRLQRQWKATLAKANFDPGDSKAVAERLAARYRPTAGSGDVEDETPDRAGKRLGGDTAVANGSSIALLFEHTAGAGTKRILLGADAFPSVLTDSLRDLAQRSKVDRIDIDLFKLPHHGSANNITDELLSVIRCDRFVVSTNGDYFNHPDPATIEAIGRSATGKPPTIYFNYRTERADEGLAKAKAAGFSIDARFPSEAKPGYLDIEV